MGDRHIRRCDGCGAWKAADAVCAVCWQADQPTEPPVSRAWMDSAACRDHDTDLWFADEDGPETTYALAVCRRCPVLAPCLAWAVAHGERVGVWGGRTANQRARVAGRRRAAR